MKTSKLFLILPLFFVMMKGNAQTLAPEVLSGAGGTIHTSNIQLAFTVGETSVARWSTPLGGFITEGFHQPTLVVSKVDEQNQVSVRIAPNPVQSKLFLFIDGKDTEEVTAILVDVQGKIMTQLNHLKGGNYELNLSEYPSGVYFLSLNHSNKLPFQTFKVVKVR